MKEVEVPLGAVKIVVDGVLVPNVKCGRDDDDNVIGRGGRGRGRERGWHIRSRGSNAHARAIQSPQDDAPLLITKPEAVG